MTGANASSTPTPTVQQRHEELLAELDRRQASLALPPIRSDQESEVTGLLEVSRAQIRGMTAEECHEAAILLQQEAFHLQRYVNRCQAQVDWIESNIVYLLAPAEAAQRYVSPATRRALAVRNNPVAWEFHSRQVKARTLAADIAYLSSRVEWQAKFFDNMARTKGKQHG